MTLQPRWHLRSSLTLLLVGSSTVALLIAFSLLLAYFQPHLAVQTRSELGKLSNDLAGRSERVLSILQSQLELVAESVKNGNNRSAQEQMDLVIGQGTFSALYHIGSNGRITHAAVSRDSQKQAAELLDSDLSNDRLRLRVMQRLQTTWSDKYLSPSSRRLAVAIGVWTGNDVIIGEIPLSYILEMLADSSDPAGWSIWVADAYGDILADSERSERIGVVNIANLPIIAKADAQSQVIDQAVFEGRTYDMAVSRSVRMHWYFVVRSPAGLASPQLRTTLNLGITAMISLMLLSLVFAPIWAAHTARPINAIAERARQQTKGETGAEWPRSSVIELNQLSADIEHMSNVIRERERELETIVESSPVGMLLTEPSPSFAFARANEAILKLLGYQRDQVLGKSGLELGLWKHQADREAILRQLNKKDIGQIETWMCRKDGSEFLAFVQARTVDIGGAKRTIWVVEDITEFRRIESEVRELNAELEARVQKRTEQLRKANNELSTTIEYLKLAQNELVRSEKLASLGSLVAGVAHELNTPIGNGVMAVSTMRDSLKRFRAESSNGLKRSVLDSFVEAVDTGSTIAERNLERAAELVASFKQVAADQTSSQRRSFKLDEVVREIALTLGPTLRHSVARLSVDIPSSITLDSYPGPLGQILTNLITNATVHAFADRDQGTIEVRAGTDADHLKLRISDDGIGIAPELLPRIFDPFVTSRMGRGGTGLGLHIAHNIAANVLGGTISVASTAGKGTTFELNIPLTAPTPDSPPA
ncbi:ATP-binding protein [Dechloromonas sp. ARDL1]|uniref:ATP-binding protein n=1 Tax=Dechloromonas sp. ARDL1 TaxID=3322121 RepID=UPI003DA715FF